MKFQLILSFLVFNLFSRTCFAWRFYGGLSGMLYDDDENEIETSPFEQLLDSCLSNLSQPIDIVIDMGAASYKDAGPWWSFWRPWTEDSKDIIEFVNALATIVPKEYLYAVVVDSNEDDGGNVTKYYLAAPPPIRIAEMTTMPPVTGFTETYDENGGTMLTWMYQQTYSYRRRPIPTLGQLLSQAFTSRAYDERLDFYPTERNASAQFTIVITDSHQKIPLSTLTSNLDVSNSVILDIAGIAVARQFYSGKNLLVVPDSSSLSGFTAAIEYMICQSLGFDVAATTTTTSTTTTTTATTSTETWALTASETIKPSVTTKSRRPQTTPPPSFDDPLTVL